MRINKYLAHVGYCSRRKADEFIHAGKVVVNSNKAVLGQNVSPSDEIKVDNNLIKNKTIVSMVYALNKPKGVVSTTNDEKSRRSVVDLIKSKERLYPVGRLDKNSTGLILMTNNGDLAYQLTHPKFEVEKEYEVLLNSSIENNKIGKLISGIYYKGINYKADRITKIVHNKYSIILHEGKNREIRKMIQAIGKEVVELRRIRIGKLELGDLKDGEYKKLTEQEIKRLI